MEEGDKVESSLHLHPGQHSPGPISAVGPARLHGSRHVAQAFGQFHVLAIVDGDRDQRRAGLESDLCWGARSITVVGNRGEPYGEFRL